MTTTVINHKRSSMERTQQRPPRVAVVSNSLTPYRIHLHQRIVAEIPEIELWSLTTHGNAYRRWTHVKVPATIRPLAFGNGEPTSEQTDVRYSLREWRKAGRIIRWMKEQQVAAVFCQGCGDMGRIRILNWCRAHQLPCFLTGDFNIRGDNVWGLKRVIKRATYRFAVDCSAGLMPCGQLGAALFERYGGTGKPTFLFPFVPDVTLFQAPPAEAIENTRRRFELDPQRRRIVFSARMMSAKRPDLAIRAFAALAAERPDWDLVMVGDGPLRESVQKTVPTDIVGRVIWTGFLNDTRDVASLYAQSDVLLLPSDREPWGVVVVEAAAAGLAIAASDVVGASPELVQCDRNGALFPAGNLEAMTRALGNVTAPGQIDARKRQSRQVLHEWLECADPVQGFRDALTCGGVRRGVRSQAVQQTGEPSDRGRASDGVAASCQAMSAGLTPAH
jgi:glycosyltransferase involved in cell wall biosynthesis